ncbi:MAG: hypothetical protein JNJ61_27120 [Anaerolineae bacterium]|nr:hypothetical protein [Anaerolineae bacterium]
MEQLLTADQLEAVITSIRPEIERAVQTAMREALTNIPTTDTVARMIDAKVDPLKAASYEQIQSIDKHLRQSEELLKAAARQMDDAMARFTENMTKVAMSIGELTATDKAQQALIDRLDGTLITVQAQMAVDRKSLTELYVTQQRLTGEIHGDPTNPLQQSVFGLIREMREETGKRFDQVISLHNELGDHYNKLNERLSPIEEYIATQRGMIKKARQAIAEVLKTTRGKVLLGATVAALLSIVPDGSPFHQLIKQFLGLP